MTKQCAWCRDDLPPEGNGYGPARAISYGICPRCLETEMGGIGTPFFAYLDQLALPVLVVNGNAEVQYANTQAEKLVGKHLGRDIGLLAGQVFECIHAGEPGGCGRTIHCSACAIRNTVTRTASTGESCRRIPATLHWRPDKGVTGADLLITTEKVKDVVLLQVDQITPR